MPIHRQNSISHPKYKNNSPFNAKGGDYTNPNNKSKVRDFSIVESESKVDKSFNNSLTINNKLLEKSMTFIE